MTPPLEESQDKTEKQIEVRARLIRIVEAINGLVQKPEWQELVDLLFSQEEIRIKRLLEIESLKKELNQPEIYRLQGELAWAKRYANLMDLAKLLKYQIDKLNG